MRTKEYLLVLDTETANTINFPLPYDLGYKIIDRQGNVQVSRSFCIYEIYCQEREMMKTAYYADKIPQYEIELKQGVRKLVRFYTAKKIITQDIEKYKIKKIFAYNVNFDKRALNNDQKYITKNKYKYFFPKDIEFCCIWHMACQVLLARPSYIKFAIKNNYLSQAGNILTNAECCYRYITKNTEFVEEHKGIDDVTIEIEILLACYKQHKKMNTNAYSGCWLMVQKKRQAIENSH